MNDTLKNKLDRMSQDEIKTEVQSKSKYGTYVINFDSNEQRRTIKRLLLEYRLYTTDSASVEDRGYFFYSPRNLKKNENGDKLPEFAIFSSSQNFIINGVFERLYSMDDVDQDKVDFKDFEEWLDDYAMSIFGYDAKDMYRPRNFIRENMKNIKKYDDFINEKKIPKISIDIKELLSVLDKSKTDIFRTFKINKDEIGVRGDIDKLYSNGRFNDNIKKNGLKHGKLNNTQYSETLLDDKYVLKFFFVYDKKSMELEEPQFIILQYFNTETNDRSDILGFTNTDNINSFYEKLTDSTIELTKGDDTFVYQTSNGGNNWEMKNVQMEDKTMKGTLDRKELQDVINKKNLDISHG